MFPEEIRFEINPDSPEWPARVEAVPDGLGALYGVGSIEALSLPSVSVSGSRRVEEPVAKRARTAGRKIAEHGLVLVCGGAIGCDREAAMGAIEAGGKVILMPGSCADNPYPKDNGDLFSKAVSTGGMVLSPFGWGYPPLPRNFLYRNKVIAALSRTLVVIKAKHPSGTWQTADTALRMRRRVLALADFGDPGAALELAAIGAHQIETMAALDRELEKAARAE